MNYYIGSFEEIQRLITYMLQLDDPYYEEPWCHPKFQAFIACGGNLSKLLIFQLQNLQFSVNVLGVSGEAKYIETKDIYGQLLMYLTYGLYDWGVSQNLFHIYQLNPWKFAILYFLRKGYAFKQTNLFKNKFDATFNSLINKKTNSTNFTRSLHFARRRPELTEAKLIYGTTSL